MNLTPVMQETRGAVGGARPSTAGTADAAPQAKPGLVAFVGTGPGDASLLTLRGAELLGQADLIIGGPELTRRLAHLLPDGATIIDPAEAPGDAGVLITAARAGQLAVRLCPGDPLLFGQAAGDAEACAKAAVRWEIVPGVPAATAVPAYAGMPLTSDAVGDVRIVHAADVSRVSTDGHAPSSLVILGAEAGPVDLAKMLMAAGWGDTTPMAITWNGTTTDQQTVLTKLSSVQADLKAAGVSVLTEDGPAVAVVGAAAARQGLSWFESKPLFGWRVLVPRTKEQAASVSDRLHSYGAVPQIVPTIAVEPPRAPQQMERAIKGLVTGRYQWIAFTSANAVRAVREKLEEYGLDARAFAGIKVAAVGEQTAAALGEFGIKADLVPKGEQSSEGLAAAWPPYDEVLDPINRVLLPPGGAADRPWLGGGGRHRVPDGPGGAPARAYPGGDQERWLRRRPVHVLIHGAQPHRDRGQAARGDRCGGDRPADRTDRRRIWAAGRRHRANGVGNGAGGRAGGTRRAVARRRDRGG